MITFKLFLWDGEKCYARDYEVSSQAEKDAVIQEAKNNDSFEFEWTSGCAIGKLILEAHARHGK